MTEAEQTQAAEHCRDEPFIHEPAGAEGRIAALIAPLMAELGFRLVRVRLSGLNGLTLQIMAERFDGSMTIEDCEFLSQNIAPLLDVENVIDRQYNLELSSPGMDRPLVRKSDFSAWRGHLAKIETQSPINGQKKFRGEIKAADENAVLFKHSAKDGGETETEIPYAAIAEASLVLTDELIRAVLGKDKQEKQKGTSPEKN